MCGGNESRLKLRWREIDAALQTSMKKTGEHLQVASLRAGKVDNRPRSKEQTKHRAEPVKRGLDFYILDRVARELFQLRARFFQQFSAIGPVELAQLRQTGRHRKWIAG